MAAKRIYIAHSNSARDRALYSVLLQFLNPLIRSNQILNPTETPRTTNDDKWFEAYHKAALEADLIVVLVSQHYLAREHSRIELNACVHAAQIKNTPLVSVQLAPSSWQDTPLFNHRTYPSSGKTLAALSDTAQEEAWLEITRHWRNVYLTDSPAEAMPQSGQPAPVYYLKSIGLTNFKCFPSFELNFNHKASVLGGRWHCIAGINGAGKSTILEAICLALLGSPKALLVGDAVIGRKCRTGVNPVDTAIKVTLETDAGETRDLRLFLDHNGIDRSRQQEQTDQTQVWDQLEHMLFMSFGATRDFNEGKKPDPDYRESIRRHLTLFRPLEPLLDEMNVVKGIDRIAFLELLNKMLDLLPHELPSGARYRRQGAFGRHSGIDPFRRDRPASSSSPPAHRCSSIAQTPTGRAVDCNHPFAAGAQQFRPA